MSDKKSRRYCKQCQGDVLAIASKPNHILHLLLSVLTAGVWLIVWFLIAVRGGGSWLCNSCGAKTSQISKWHYVAFSLWGLIFLMALVVSLAES